MKPKKPLAKTKAVERLPARPAAARKPSTRVAKRSVSKLPKAKPRKIASKAKRTSVEKPSPVAKKIVAAPKPELKLAVPPKKLVPAPTPEAKPAARPKKLISLPTPAVKPAAARKNLASPPKPEAKLAVPPKKLAPASTPEVKAARSKKLTAARTAELQPAISLPVPPVSTTPPPAPVPAKPKNVISRRVAKTRMPAVRAPKRVIAKRLTVSIPKAEPQATTAETNPPAPTAAWLPAQAPSPESASPIPCALSLPAPPQPPAATQKPPPTEIGGVKIPAILWEGDEPVALPRAYRGPSRGPEPAPRPSGISQTAAQEFQFSQSQPVFPWEGVEHELPEAYGTGRVFLTPRDPRCLHAHWDLTTQQQRDYLSLAADRQLSIRVFFSSATGPRASEVHVHPESRSWFIHVDRPGATYVAELGYYQPDGQWSSIAVSEPARTPSDAVSADTTVQFATIQTEPSSRQTSAVPTTSAASLPAFVATATPVAETGTTVRLEPVPPSVRAEMPPMVAPFSLPIPAHTTPSPLPPPQPSPEVRTWSSSQEEALAELIGVTIVRQDWPASAEIAELLRGQPAAAISSAEAARLGITQPSPAPVSSPEAIGQISSPPGGEIPGHKQFWFNVNAELVVYGATEPDATVTIGGRQIKLRPDGSFSYRFSLPDGQYSLPISAIATHGDTRRAELSFRRATAYNGEVAAHPQDPALKAPSPEHLV